MAKKPTSRYYLVEAGLLPEIFLKVMEAKELLHTGECATVGEAAALESGRLTQQQVDNRNLLRGIMKRAGWVTLQSEWWHFNAYTRTYTKEHYPLFPL